MIKVGDKVICKKGWNGSIMFFEGKSYEVISVENHWIQIVGETNKPDIANGYWFPYNHTVNNYLNFYTCTHFENFFMTLAEFREQQIKSVIDD